MTAPNEAPPVASPQSGKLTSFLVKDSGTLAHAANRTEETGNAVRRSGVRRPVRDWEAGFQSGI